MIQINKIRFFINHVILPLLAGCFIYIFFRETKIIALSIFYEYFKTYEIYNLSPIFKILTGSLPDFFWLYALLSFQTGIIWNGIQNTPQLIFIILYTIPIGTELMQYYHIIDGTGDYADIIAYLLAIILHYLIHKNNLHETHSKAYS
ncbi:MAG: hypothetical protein RLZZ196_863 [Bacteroidota bacterium]|jgi:hypothetical protein